MRSCTKNASQEPPSSLDDFHRSRDEKKFVWGKHLGKKMVVWENIFEFKIYCLNN
jgi:hypothetical protein